MRYSRSGTLTRKARARENTTGKGPRAFFQAHVELDALLVLGVWTRRKESIGGYRR